MFAGQFRYLEQPFWIACYSRTVCGGNVKKYPAVLNIAGRNEHGRAFMPHGLLNAFVESLRAKGLMASPGMLTQA